MIVAMISWNPKFLYYFVPLIRISKYINWRFGRKYRCSDLNTEQLRKLLHPGMILLSRKEYEISNFFIDGYWTHTAMILEEDKVVEATSKGVVITSLNHFFLRTDDFVLMKPRFCGAKEMKEASRGATEMIGMPYSFDFNNSDKDVYCSELVLKMYARSCGWNRQNHMEPDEFKHLCEGKIVPPSSLYRNRNAWEIVFQMS
jgi:uncharacterized protein YycO